MPRGGALGLVVVLGLFGWAMLALFETRFDVGDSFARGSSLRSDALGTRAIYEAVSEALPKQVSRHRGRSGVLAKATDATIIVSQLQLSYLIIKRQPLITELTEAVRGGARLVVTLDDAEGQVCRKTYCNEETRSRCHPLRADQQDVSKSSLPSSAPSAPSAPTPKVGPGPAEPSPVPSIDSTCEDAALGLWGFEVGGRKSLPTIQAERSASAPGNLPRQLPWTSPAKFIELDSAFRVIYSGDEGALIVERSLGKGSLVLMNEGYLLSNEAQRLVRKPEFVIWLLGNQSRVIFEESHLGVLEQRGIMSLVRDLKLEGVLWGAVLLFGLYVWKVTSPLSRRLEARLRLSSLNEDSSSTLLALLRRSMSPKAAMTACVEEARQSGLSVVVTRAAHTKLVANAETFNQIFCADQERPPPR